ncbi:hypothetical protein [Bacteroides caecigallinarum]|uniref:hypothetical protein n=1 Tax=Bacteroides caecigallinarum TaxID=1411144 RepID=UPI001F2801AE|nr:hypothetical protein [Bacteroides caecigallinarum]MCF2738727.1 hypothetical protein [Bacteroides caecigallinarum]
MRGLNIFKSILFIAYFGILCSSCSKDILPNNENDNSGSNSKEYLVSLGYSGEISDIETSPLSRNANNNDIYGIQVYSCPTDENLGQNYKSYAYGIFNDKSNMTIRLFEGYKYKFIATMIVDGTNKIWNYNKEGYKRYSYPFNADLRNIFVYTSNEDKGHDLGSGWSGINGAISSEIYHRPNTDRYYGETTDYIPTENGSVNINMKRTVFGVKVLTEDFTEGTIKVRIENAPEMSFTYPETYSTDIFSFYNIYSAYHYSASSNKDYIEELRVSVTRMNADSLEIPVATQTVAFERNKLTTLTVKIVSNSNTNTLSFNIENVSMTEGENVTFEGGGDMETPIDPEV